MIRKGRLFTPGPTQLLPSAQLAMAAASMHHRTAEFRALYSRVLADLKTFVGTASDVVLFTASGTGAMEAAVSNLTSPGDDVLVVSAGKFGERWESLAKAYGCQVETVRSDYGQTVTPQQVKEKLKPSHTVLFMQASESSTGARHDVQAIAQLLKGSSTLLVVDAITGLGTTRFDVDGWGIDIIIGGSQKAVMIPPGLAYCAVSERAWQRMESTKNPRYYFDLRKERKNGAKGESSYTPSTALVAALAAAFDYLREQGSGDLAAGRDVLIDNAETAAAMTRAAAQALGLKLYAAAAPGAALTAITSPEGIDSSDIVKAFRSGFGAVVANGQGEMKGQLFRIAHLGFYDYLDTIAIIGALELVLAGTGRKVELGSGMAAAQKVFAQSFSPKATK
ncbi:MAG TPA: alanine--glyoxylate aminotransferase family protein [Candidatus Saccharimonadales bacterium]|jgi:aspartate aminotransferase-like enzyme|nr:alanine--glyoxylate aminotransferase family protein [Candidatus Saccharimonadales bacterium]